MVSQRPLALGIAIGFVFCAGLVTWINKRQEHIVTGPVCDAQQRTANLDFRLKDTSGREVDLRDYAGKVLVVDFWATWCAPCKIEIPGFVSLYDKYRAQGLEVVGLVSMDEMKNVPAFMQEYRMNYPVLDAIDRADIERAFGPLVGLPTTVVIGRDGKVCTDHLGYTTIERFEAEIRALL